MSGQRSGGGGPTGHRASASEGHRGRGGAKTGGLVYLPPNIIFLVSHSTNTHAFL